MSKLRVVLKIQVALKITQLIGELRIESKIPDAYESNSVYEMSLNNLFNFFPKPN